LGTSGLDDDAARIFAEKNQRVILISIADPRPNFGRAGQAILNIDMGWLYGEATVTIPGYPVKLFPASGLMQIVAYESINVEVLARLPKP
jgi:hypothetical protein